MVEKLLLKINCMIFIEEKVPHHPTESKVKMCSNQRYFLTACQGKVIIVHGLNEWKDFDKVLRENLNTGTVYISYMCSCHPVCLYI